MMIMMMMPNVQGRPGRVSMVGMGGGEEELAGIGEGERGRRVGWDRGGGEIGGEGEKS